MFILYTKAHPVRAPSAEKKKKKKKKKKKRKNRYLKRRESERWRSEAKSDEGWIFFLVGRSLREFNIPWVTRSY